MASYRCFGEDIGAGISVAERSLEAVVICLSFHVGERDFRQSGVYQSASAAHSVVGAIRTGKAIAGAASGAAAGPYGLMVTAALNSKNAVRNILIAVGSFLMIPIIIMCMLPSIVFCGLTDAFSSFDPNSPILNSDLAIQAISDFISQSIEEVLKEALENIEDRIKAEYLAAAQYWDTKRFA